MLYLLHGENVSASREALLELKKDYSPNSVSTFDAKKFDADEFARVYETPSLLSDRRLIVIDGKLPSPALKQLDDLAVSDTADIVFWVGEQLKPSNKLFKLTKELGGQIRAFKPTIPKHVFGFLDALGYKNKQKSFLELHRLLDQGESPVYLLTMIVWQIRNLLRAKLYNTTREAGRITNSSKTIVHNGGGPKPKMNPFVLRKAQSQVKNFEEEELIGIFRRLLEAEISLKTTQQDPKLVLDLLVDRVTNV